MSVIAAACGSWSSTADIIANHVPAVGGAMPNCDARASIPWSRMPDGGIGSLGLGIAAGGGLDIGAGAAIIGDIGGATRGDGGAGADGGSAGGACAGDGRAGAEPFFAWYTLLLPDRWSIMSWRLASK